MPTIESRAGRVSYREQGSGPPVLLLHATLHDGRDFDPIIPVLARDHRVIALDWPGHGDSEAPTAPLTASAVLFADVLEDVVEALDLPPTIVIGNSVGGFAAARLAIDHPERVAGLVLVNSGGFIPWTFASRAFCRLLGHPTVARRVFPRLVSSYMVSKTASDLAIQARVEARARTREGAATAASLWRSFPSDGHDLRGRAQELRVPTLIVWGSQDTAIPLKAGRATHEAIAGSRLEVLETGHVVFSSAPEEFLALVEPFIASLAPSRPPKSER